ncbi:MAG: sugar transferase [Planctomycetota bacterium]|jgi:lipopolysaccharide/colanic/teichoic acid biosynthesis glycosyltransferase
MSLCRICKRGFEIVMALLAIMLLSPVFVVLAVVIRLSGRGPVIFVQERAGKDGEPFTFYKFRTMKVDADAFGPSPKSGDDPRLTKIGKFLREYSLDELPQLFNIIKGNMSIVGPRPLYVSQMDEWNQRQKKRLLVKPGLTGLAQISGRGGLTREQKLELDVEYVETASMWLDCKIIMATIAHVAGRKNVYEKRYSQTQVTRGESLNDSERKSSRSSQNGSQNHHQE